MENKKPSFLSSMMSGIGGFFKGALAGGAVGVVAGIAVAAVSSLIFPGAAAEIISAIAPTAAADLGPMAAAATIGGTYGGLAFGTLGGYSGMATEVVRSREAAQVSGQDVVDVAKISYAQGIGVGHHLSQAQAAETEQTKFRDKIMQERAGRAAGQQQIH